MKAWGDYGNSRTLVISQIPFGRQNVVVYLKSGIDREGRVMRRIYWDRAMKAEQFKIKKARQRVKGLHASAAINRKASIPDQPVYVPPKREA